MEPFISAAKDINVEEIMATIRKKIQDKKDSGLLKQREIDEIAEMELQPLPDFLEIPNVYEPHLYPDLGRSDIPAYPGYGQYTDIPAPVAEEIIMETGLAKGVLKKIRDLFSPLIRFMTRPLYLELKATIFGLRTEVFGLKTEVFGLKTELAETLAKHLPVILQSSEYIKLLHNTINNMIVEASKLKTEEELLKTKIKILEDKMEFLENRERALEKKLSPS